MSILSFTRVDLFLDYLLVLNGSDDTENSVFVFKFAAAFRPNKYMIFWRFPASRKMTASIPRFKVFFVGKIHH